jgi:hypothetical protein
VEGVAGEREDRRSAVERLVVRAVEEQTGRPISERARQLQRSVDAYLRAGAAPRWMQRINEIERGVKRHRVRLERAYEALREECGHDPDAFARRWTDLAGSWRFDELNELVRQHNDWYPIERDLPIDLRTRDYVRVNGRSYRRFELGPEWVLEQFPPRP